MAPSLLGLDPYLNMKIITHHGRKLVADVKATGMLTKEIEIEPGVDALDIVCYAIILDEMLEEQPSLGNISDMTQMSGNVAGGLLDAIF